MLVEFIIIDDDLGTPSQEIDVIAIIWKPGTNIILKRLEMQEKFETFTKSSTSVKSETTEPAVNIAIPCEGIFSFAEAGKKNLRTFSVFIFQHS